jgi:hypothetical protein
MLMAVQLAFILMTRLRDSDSLPQDELLQFIEDAPIACNERGGWTAICDGPDAQGGYETDPVRCTVRLPYQVCDSCNLEGGVTYQDSTLSACKANLPKFNCKSDSPIDEFNCAMNQCIGVHELRHVLDFKNMNVRKCETERDAFRAQVQCLEDMKTNVSSDPAKNELGIRILMYDAVANLNQCICSGKSEAACGRQCMLDMPWALKDQTKDKAKELCGGFWQVYEKQFPWSISPNAVNQNVLTIP